MLWCWIKNCKDTIDQSYTMVQILIGSGKINNFSILESNDSLIIGAHQIQFIPCTAIKSVVYVLPSIDHGDTDRTEYDKYFHIDQEKNKHFMVIKPVEMRK